MHNLAKTLLRNIASHDQIVVAISLSPFFVRAPVEPLQSFPASQ
jgi:hypothetical protein